MGIFIIQLLVVVVHYFFFVWSGTTKASCSSEIQGQTERLRNYDVVVMGI